MPTSPWILLAIAIVTEVIATSSLKVSDGFTRLWPSVVVVIGYGISFYALALTMRSLPVGVIYAIWSGLGITLVTLVGWFVFKQHLSTNALIGIGLIIVGVIVMNLSPSAATH
ncbi:MAG: multidrug efflux SMR transporter [Burkholderiaceae bacterium]|nr:multidrug efflux SMR transporter [Burkholderiaceae bacterium]MCD8516894.1 multidrug efflux SMR transporter [Burkholderiaceae bacterium]MCD8537588.1 multidrug efflux SMR transporter [Burkholderiaceae bacterium]MCD8565603.1 multidrug efflux SMR transporter [Burkholderiaceae bacterium]